MEDVKKEDQLTPGESFRLDMYFWLQAFVVVLIALILLFTFVGRIIGVDGSSMVPTLHNGDMVLLQTIGYKPQQNHVVVVTHKPFSEEPIIKRVIATEGQKVVIDAGANTVTVDGVTLDEPYINEPMTGGSVLEYTVPQGHIFVMGDNRNHSSDSRSDRIGFLDEREVLGRAHMVVFPFSSFGGIR